MQPAFVRIHEDEEGEKEAKAVQRRIARITKAHADPIADDLAAMGRQLTLDEGAGIDEILGLAGRVAEARNETMLQGSLFSMLHDAVEAGTAFGIAELRDHVEVGFSWDQAHRQALQWAEAYQFDLVTRIDDSTRHFISAQVTEWMKSGEPLDDLTGRLAWAFGEDRAHLIAQTEATRGFAQGAIASYRESGVVSRLRWYTVVDDRVCEICGPLHGTTSDLAHPNFDGIDSPPAHPGCRCRVSPVIGESGV